MKPKNKDIVFTICQSMLQASPEASYKRLNPALYSTLASCIEADLPFQQDTFRRIYDELRGGWWFGDGAGSHVGESFYKYACKVGHASAQQSFEHFAGRPAVLWEEHVKTLIRLHVGSEFTWKGHYVTVTSLRKDSLVACTYQDYRSRVKGLKVGATVGYDPEYLITSSKRDGNATLLRVVKTPEARGDRTVAKRFTITYAEISEFRREAKARLKSMLDKIAKCDPEKDAAKLTKEINASHFRHLDLEAIRSAFTKRKAWKANEGRIEAWRKGANGAFLDVELTLLRVCGDRVDCSNGNSVSMAAATRVLPVLLDNRRKSVALDVPVDSYRIQQVSAAGVKIGCTLVPWPEVERIAPELQITK